MGNCVSRCSNSRGKLLPCSRKRFNEDEPMLSSTYESEAPHDPHKNNYQGPCRYPSELLIDRSGDEADGGRKTTPAEGQGQGHSSVDLLDTSGTNRSQRSQSRSPALQSRKSSTTTTPSTTPKSGRFKFNWKGYRTLRSSSGGKKRKDNKNNSTKKEEPPTPLSNVTAAADGDDEGRRLVDTSCQTVIDGDALKNVPSLPQVSSTPEPSSIGLTKEYIVRTYSIQNATPSPSTHHKFSPSNPIVPPSSQTPTAAGRTSSTSSSSSSSSSTAKTTSDLNGSLVVPNTPPPILEETIRSEVCDSGRLFCAATPHRSSFGLGGHRYNHSSQPTGDGPLACLEHRQLQVVNKLEKLKDSVSSLAQKYNVSTTSSSSSSSSTTLTGPAVCTPKDLGKCVKDMVISADPSSIPLSLIMLGQLLESQYTVYKGTFVHSSVTSPVPDSLTQMMLSNGGRSRTSCQLALTLMWKKVSNGPQLVVDPTKQTPIHGEANVIRYLARLLQPAYDDTADILSATQIDDFLDLAQIQILEGNAKEKAAALRSLNSSLGKKDWLVGNGPTIADYVCWSALHQAGLVSAPPANVKKWLSNCSNHDSFKTALSLVDVSS